MWTCMCIFIISVILPQLHCLQELTITICEDRTETINCDDGKYVTISRAMFGRNPDNMECLHLIRFVKSCSADGVTNKVKGECEGRQSCQLTASRHIYGDPCIFIKKYLEVVYMCAERQLFSSAKLNVTFNSGDSIERPWTTSKSFLVGITVGLLVLAVIAAIVTIKLVRNNNNNGVTCNMLFTKKTHERTPQGHYQTTISAISNHEYDSIQVDEHTYISMV